MNFANKTAKYAKKHNIYKKARENKLKKRKLTEIGFTYIYIKRSSMT